MWEFLREGVDITQLPLTMDSAYVSQELRERLHQLGFIDIIIAGKGNYVFTIDAQKWDAATWKKVLMLEEPGVIAPRSETNDFTHFKGLPKSSYNFIMRKCLPKCQMESKGRAGIER